MSSTWGSAPSPSRKYRNLAKDQQPKESVHVTERGHHSKGDQIRAFVAGIATLGAAGYYTGAAIVHHRDTAQLHNKYSQHPNTIPDSQAYVFTVGSEPFDKNPWTEAVHLSPNNPTPLDAEIQDNGPFQEGEAIRIEKRLVEDPDRRLMDPANPDSAVLHHK